METLRTPQIFIQQLFKLQKQNLIDDKTIKDQVNLLIFGVNIFDFFLKIICNSNIRQKCSKGNDTSAIATSHAVLLLAMHPEIQDRAMQEIDEVFPSDRDAAPATTVGGTSVEQVSQLHYLEMVVKEAMRLFPVAPFLSRECTGDTVISKFEN